MLGAFPSSSSSGLIPGEMSLAHGGMLCLDELAEFPRNVLESLRGPLESGEVHLSRAGGVARIPMTCIVGASANPCPCGFLGEGPARCRCSISDIEKGLRRLSGPLIDRFPIHLETALFPKEDGNLPRWLTNSHDAAEAIREVRSIGADAGAAPPPSAEGREFLRALRHNVGCSERGRNSVLAVSRTLLALDMVTSGGVFIGAEREDLERSALLTAAQCRIFDRTSWIEGARKRNSHRHERNRIELPRLHTPHS
jgi:magnesium chelatase family protein